MPYLSTISRRQFALGAAGFGLAGTLRASTRDYPIRAIPVQDVKITDAFWRPRIEKARTVSLPMLLARAEERNGRMDGRLTEAAAYFLMANPDPALQNRVRGLAMQSLENLRRQKGVWANRGDGPFFSVGHFIEGGVAFAQATGDRTLLDGAIEIADDVDRTFGPGRRYDISNHEGIELALVKLYLATGEDRYFQLAKFLVDTRGTTNGGRAMYGPYAQDHMPVKAQPRAIGHCVRGTYLYAAVADLGALGPDPEYRAAAIRIWEDAVSKRTFLTGGVGSYRAEEDFGDDYDLPNLGCWNEICACVGNALWNHRMFLMTGESRYVDVMEKILYNGMLAGVSFSGDHFLYQTPLKATSEFERQPWFGPNCCPPNITRLMGELSGLIYAHTDDGLWTNLFVTSQAKCKVGGVSVGLSQETNYPWDGGVRLTVSPERPTTFALRLRAPGWQRGEAMPGGLYRFANANGAKFELAVNGRPVSSSSENGYAKIEREWRAGDTVTFTLPMETRRIVSDTRVAENRGMVALQRGPLLYCAEGADNSKAVFRMMLPDNARIGYQFRKDLLEGIGTLTGEAQVLDRAAGGKISRQKQALTAIPFFAFGNRGPGEMAVWLAREPARAAVAPAPTIASRSKVTSSCGNGGVADNYPDHKPPTIAQRLTPNAQDGSGDIRAVCDQMEPPNSEDGSGMFLRLRPQSGDQAWVQYDFAEPAKVSSASVYWKDDKQYVALPKSWRLLYKDGDEWKPVRAAAGYGVAPGRYNQVKCEPVMTSSLRLEIQLQPKVYTKNRLGPPDGNYLSQDLTWYEGGVIEWRVNE